MTKRKENNPSEVRKFLGSENPLAVLKNWLNKAKKNKGLKNPWAMNLSTSENGRPSGRIILLKHLKGDSLIFFSNYRSEKGRSLQNNALASAVFYWENPGRQIRIEGRVRRIARKESKAYWNTRSRNSRLSQWISEQSRPVLNRKTLDSLWQTADRKFKNKSIPCPLHWGGYALSIKKIEFWLEKEHRLHDRFLFKKRGGSWLIQRLFP